jgi:hypothetical protein
MFRCWAGEAQLEGRATVGDPGVKTFPSLWLMQPAYAPTRHDSTYFGAQTRDF